VSGWIKTQNMKQLELALYVSSTVLTVAARFDVHLIPKHSTTLFVITLYANIVDLKRRTRRYLYNDWQVWAHYCTGWVAVRLSIK